MRRENLVVFDTPRFRFYKSPWGNHPRLQILTIAELFDGARIDYPPTVNITHKRAPRHLPEPAAQHALPLTDDDSESLR